LKKTQKPRGWLVSRQVIDDALAKATMQLSAQEYDAVIRTCKRILHYLPKQEKLRAQALGLMGMAYALQKRFEESYQILNDAVQLDPADAALLFNRALSARFTSRSGQSLRDFEMIASMDMDHLISNRINDELEIARKVAFSERDMRGPDFTLEQLIEQQELFQHGNYLSGQARWIEAEASFRKSIAMGDCLPQPWGNLGICLLMQNRFNEADAALQRALIIDPGYERARENLVGLDYWREHPDEKPEFQVTSPFQDMETNVTIYPE